MRVSSVCFWHSEGWTPRNEALLDAVVKQARTTKHPWLIACDANMSPSDFEKSMKFQSKRMFIEAPAEVSTCRSRGPEGDLIERAGDYVIASRSLRGRITRRKVVADIESRPHMAVSCVVEREKESRNGANKVPKALPVISGGKLRGRSKAAKGKEEEDEEKENQERQMRSEVTQEIVTSRRKEVDEVGDVIIRNTGPIPQGTTE